MAQAPPPEVLKNELYALLRRTLESEDTTEMDQLYQTIVQTSNRLRQQYGMNAKDDALELYATLKPPNEQLRLSGVGSEIVMGHAVFARACAPRTGERLFDQCFTANDTAAAAFKHATAVADRYLAHHAKLVVYPPLLLRAQADECVQIHVDSAGRVCRASGTNSNALLVLLASGPIIPVLSQKDHANFRALVQSLYGLTGNATAQALEKAVTFRG